MSSDILKEIIFRGNEFPETKYYKAETVKRQIVLHHTVSGRGVDGDINWWKQGVNRIATHFIIDWQGRIHQLFSSKYWAHHLGVPTSTFEEFNIPLRYGIINNVSRVINNRLLDMSSIAIELDSWGGLVRDEKTNLWHPGDYQNGKFLPRTNIAPIPFERVYTYPYGYRGYYGYETYTDEQIHSLSRLVNYLCDVYVIPKDYNDDMWFKNVSALTGTPGIWSHTSFREDKSDIHPQANLKKMLMSLK